MEYRKLISFGKNSFVISLPKHWVRRNKLEKGALIYIDEKDSSLIVSSRETEPSEAKTKVINVDGKGMLRLERELNSAYIENYREIIFKGKEIKDKSKILLEKVRELIALEVLELDTQKIATKDFLNMDKTSVLELVKKIDMILRSILKDCTNSFNEDNADNIGLRDMDVNRMSFLVYRIIRHGLRNASKMIRNFDLTPSDLLNYYLVTFHLEDIADGAKRVSRYMRRVNLSKTEQSTFRELMVECEELYLGVIKAYYQEDRKLGFDLSAKKKNLIRRSKEFSKGIKKLSSEVTLLEYHFNALVAEIHELSRLIYQR